MEMNFDISGSKEIRYALAKAALMLSPAKMKKMLYQVGTVIQSETLENIAKKRTYDGGTMPQLRPSTIKHKKRIGKTDYLKVNGGLQKLNIKSQPDEVRVVSQGYSHGNSYASILNQRKKRPFKFMGFGKKLIDKVLSEIRKRTWDLMFK